MVDRTPCVDHSTLAAGCLLPLRWRRFFGSQLWRRQRRKRDISWSLFASGAKNCSSSGFGCCCSVNGSFSVAEKPHAATSAAVLSASFYRHRNYIYARRQIHTLYDISATTQRPNRREWTEHITTISRIITISSAMASPIITTWTGQVTQTQRKSMA